MCSDFEIVHLLPDHHGLLEKDSNVYAQFMCHGGESKVTHDIVFNLVSPKGSIFGVALNGTNHRAHLSLLNLNPILFL
jgi:hypothetical protein